MGLEITIETQSDLHLAEWAAAANQTKQLALHIYPVIMGGRIRKIYFYDCHLLRWENSFSSIGDQPLSETLQISAAGVRDTDSAGEYSAYWRETFDGVAVGATTLGDEEEEQIITKQYITDVNDIELDKYHMGDKLFFVIESQNMVGESVDIKLINKEVDFLYKNKRLIDDTISNFTISSNIEKIPLQVISEEHNELD